jgi:AcrR family transcriptional regulator
MDGSAAPSPRRRPLDGGYARGEETRERIIEAAFVVFADEGYVGASTRRIAAEAGVNPPALQYYFDSKEGLHRACGQAIVDRVIAVLGPTLDQASTVIAHCNGAAAVECLCTLVEQAAEFAIAKSDNQGWSRFMGRCQADDLGPATQMVEDSIANPLKAAAIGLVACALKRDTTDAEVRLRAILILSQLAALHTHHDSTLATVGWPDFDADRLTVVKAVLRQHVTALVG